MTEAQRIKVMRVSGSFMASLCRGAACVLNGAGVVIQKSTEVTGSALHNIADGIETVGKTSSSACYAGAEAMAKKAVGYDISDISDEELTEALRGDQEMEEAYLEG